MTGLYPRWEDVPRQDQTWTLAHYDPSTLLLTDEAGTERRVRDVAQLREAAFKHHLLVLTSDVRSIPGLLEHTTADELRGGDEVRMRLSLIRGRRRYHVVRWSDWCLQHEPPEYGLATLRRMFTHCGVGVCTTPSQLGKTLAARSWTGGRHSYPSKHAACVLKRRGHGQRQQRMRFVRPEQLPSLRDVDNESAYPEHWRLHPTGTAIWCPRHEPCTAFTWFGRCTVVVHDSLPLGPVPIVVGTDSSGRAQLDWPCEPGTYEAWLWAEHAADARTAGCTVQFHEGYCWDACTTDGAAFADRMVTLRNTAPGEDGGPDRRGLVGQLCKLAANSYIGTQGVGISYGHLRDYHDGDKPVCIDGRLTDLGIGQKGGRTTMIHWQRYTMMRCGQRMYRDALPFAERGTLVSIDVDCIAHLERIAA